MVCVLPAEGLSEVKVEALFKFVQFKLAYDEMCRCMTSESHYQRVIVTYVETNDLHNLQVQGDDHPAQLFKTRSGD